MKLHACNMHITCNYWPKSIPPVRAVFKWLSKVIMWLWLLQLVIGLKDSRQFFSQWEAKPKPIAPCTRDFSRALSKFHIIIIARNCDCFIALFAPVVIGRRYSFGFGFSTVIWKPLYVTTVLIDAELNWGHHCIMDNVFERSLANLSIHASTDQKVQNVLQFSKNYNFYYLENSHLQSWVKTAFCSLRKLSKLYTCLIWQPLPRVRIAF